MKAFFEFFLFRSLVLCSFFLLPFQLYGVGAYPYPLDLDQPDGTPLTIRLHGDEWFNWISVLDGYRIVRNQDGVFEYATVLKNGNVVPSGVKASNPEERVEEEIRFLMDKQPGPGVSREVIQNIRHSYFTSYLKSGGPSTYFAPSGEQKLLVILATFNDTQPSYSQEDFDRFMNEPGYNGKGSFRDYYLENSNGELNMISYVTEWVTVPNPKAYYGPDEKWGEFAYHAIQAAAAQGVDFSEFDNNGNGMVEGVAIIHQGPGQEATGDEEDIWSHAWSLSSAGFNQSQRTFNGVEVNRYTVQPETRNLFGGMSSIGVICHEFGHNLGVPDYYDTSDNDQKNLGTGRWDIMASGTYNGTPSGSSPAHHNAFSKIELGWISESEISTAQRHTLFPVISSGKVFRVNSPVEHEYLLLENRRQHGFDASLPGTDMVVYHVDENRISDRRRTNDINTGDHQGLYVMAAGGSVNAGSAPFPGSLNRTQLTDETNPATITWTGVPFNRSITGIHMEDENVIFDFMAIQNGSPLTMNALAQDSDVIKIEWTPSIDNAPVVLAWSADGVFGEPQQGVLYEIGDEIQGGGTVLYVGDEEQFFYHVDLLPSTFYYYSIWSDLEDSWSFPLIAMAETRSLPVIEFPWNDAFENGLDNWNHEFVTGGYTWELRQEGIEDRPPESFIGNYFASFFVPSFGVNKTRLVSPVLGFESDVSYVLEFRHVQSVWDEDQDYLRVMAKSENEQEWQELAFYQENTEEWTQRKLAIPYSESAQIAFEGHGRYGYGIGLDNVIVRPANHSGAAFSGVSDVQVSDKTESGMRLSWAALNEGESLLIVARRGFPVTEIPDEGATYEASHLFGEGEYFGNESFVVYSGSGNEITLENMLHSSNYHFAFFVFDGDVDYQFEPQNFIFSTQQRFFTITFLITDGENPVEGAEVNINGETLFSDAGGMTYWIEGYSEEYMSVSVSGTGFIDKWTRIKPDRELSIEFEMVAVEPLQVTGLSHSHDKRKVDLKWNPLIDEWFDGYQAFSLSMPGWTMIDGDQSVTYRLSGLNFPNQNYTGSFIVLDPHYEGLLQAGFDMTAQRGRHLLAAFSAVGQANDDWLISPFVLVEEGYEFSFMARSLSDTYGLERIRVLISDQDSPNPEYELLSEGENLEVPVQWTRYSFSLDEYYGKNAKLAIHYVSDDVLALLIDNVSLQPANNTESPQAEPNHKVTEIIKVQKSYKETQSAVSPKFVESSSANPDQGHIAYSVMLNDEFVGETSGFDQTNMLVEVEDCRDNVFNVVSRYVKYHVESPWSVDYKMDACYSVVFKITNEFDEPLEDVKVEFDYMSLMSNSDGEVIFTGVEGGNEMIYSIDTPGYLPVSSSVDVNANVEVTVVMQSLGVDSTSLHIDDIVLHPIPVKSELFIAGISPGSVRVELFDISGRKLYSVEHRGGRNMKVNTSFLKPGIYILRLHREEATLNFRILK